MFFNETFSVAALKFCKEGINLNQKRKRFIEVLSQFSFFWSCSLIPFKICTNHITVRKKEQYTCTIHFTFDLLVTWFCPSIPFLCSFVRNIIPKVYGFRITLLFFIIIEEIQIWHN